MTTNHAPGCSCDDYRPVTDALRLLRGMRNVDLSPTIERGIPRWPTHPHLTIDPTMTHARDGYFCQSLSMPEHIGCHVDAPAHIVADMMDATIDTFPVDHLVSEAAVYHFAGRDWKPGDLLTVEDVLEHERRTGVAAKAGDIALVDFGWMKRFWRLDSRAQWYADNAPGMHEDVCILFKERGVRAVGADTIACDAALVDGRTPDMPGHWRHWLPHRILILECVANLERLTPRCLFVAGALPIKGGSGSPLRPIAYCP